MRRQRSSQAIVARLYCADKTVNMLSGVRRVLQRPRSWLTVEPVLFLYMFATFLCYSSLQLFLKQIICTRTPNCTALNQLDVNITTSSSVAVPNLSSCGEELDDIEQQVQSEASHWLLYINIASGVPSVLVSLVYGGLSDRLGRKLFIVLPVIGTAFNALVILLLTYFSGVLPLAFLLVGALVAGSLGNFSVENFAVYSYVSDISTKTCRTKRMGILESMTYFGGTLSLVLGGLWVTKSNSFGPIFWCVIACNMTILFYVLVALPESRKLHSNATSGCNRMLSLSKSIGNNLCNYFKLLLTSWKLALLMVIYFVIEINFIGITDVVIFYSLGEPLCWSADLIGYFLALKIFLNGLASLLLLPLLSAIGMSDTIIILIGLLSGAAALVVMGFATTTWIMFIGELVQCHVCGISVVAVFSITVPVIGSVRSWVEPCVRSMLSKIVDEDQKGDEARLVIMKDFKLHYYS